MSEHNIEEAPITSRYSEYVSRKKRALSPFASDEQKVYEILLFAREYPDEAYCGHDTVMVCPHCETENVFESGMALNLRKVMLHTLHHGSIQVGIADGKCPSCGKDVRMMDSKTLFSVLLSTTR